MNSTLLILLVVVIALVIAGAVAWFYLRRKWIEEFAARGWNFVDDPDISDVYGLNVPPFGIGEDRRLKDLVSGDMNGVPFRVLNYRSAALDGWMAAFPLPRAYPAIQVGALRPETVGFEIDVPGLPGTGLTADPDFDNVVVPAIAPALAPFAHLAPVAITIDGRHLTVGPLPHKAAEMEPFLRAGAGVARAIAAAGDRLNGFPAPPVPPELSLYGYPQWRFRVQDDSMLGRVRHSGGGYDHEARRVLFNDDGPLPFIALTHHWKTRHTTTDSDGKSRTEVRHHEEDLVEVIAPRGFRDLSINDWALTKRPIRFESSRFNADFKVRCDDPKFAHDVIHPRMMEFLETTSPPAFAIEDGVIRPNLSWSPEQIGWLLGFLEGFFARVPSFVWANLGYAEPPWPEAS